MNKTSCKTRFSYALPDIAGQLIFTFIIGGYMGKFFTDVFGLTAVTCGTILGIARFVDGVDAPVWGMIFDRTHSRLGKFRPWFLWLCVPFATFGVLTFLTPDLSYDGKVIYAAAAYILCSVLYTGINTPVTSILSTLTTSPQERITLMSFRMYGSKLGVLLVNLTALKLVAVLGRGDDRKGYALTLLIFAICSIFLFLLSFRNLKEIVPQEKKNQPVLGTFGALKGNWPWFIIFVSSFLFWIGFISRITVVPYFLQYNLQREDLTRYAYSMDFVSLATVSLLPWFCKWFSKTAAWGWGLAIMVIGQLILYFGIASGNSISLVTTGWIIGFLGSGMAMAVPFAILSDSVDYGEWKTGIRAAGLLTAVGAAFCLKAGAGLGAAIPLWIMGLSGYQANVEQTPAALKAIEFGIVWLPAICLTSALLPVLFYRRFERMEPQIHAELDKRRATA
ncbi:MAG TPA: MFS transporter [Verrucomicrobiae bacterium]|nr:MFS transporter [Verrucomicrobiae bacterium]